MDLHQQDGNKEKRAAALGSVTASVLLTAFKIVVGLSTGSLGILAEAAHSGLDLVAATITLFAVQVSGRPADATHLYGHGKFENLSALVEVALLLFTCIWIIYEAIQRLFFHPVEVDASVWAFLVMIVSIGVDLTRSRALRSAAVKHNSQALEADALHFSTDIWSSLVVLLGLTLLRLSYIFPVLAFLRHADAVAAVGVAAIVVYVSLQLGGRTVAGLTDATPNVDVEAISRLAEAVPGVINAHNVRLRSSGPQLFVDVHVIISGSESLRNVHALMGRVEAAIRQMLPNADITVHPEPDDPMRIMRHTNTEKRKE